MTWSNMIEQRDAAGNLTDLALALDALSDNGCDCGEDEPGTCLACVCERALRTQWERVQELRVALDAAARSLAALSHAGARQDNRGLVELIDVREYAASRARVAFDALLVAQATEAQR